MNKPAKIIILAIVIGLGLTLLSLVIVRQTTSISYVGPTDFSCGFTPQTQATRGYPLGYLLPTSSSTDPTDDLCEGADSAGADLNNIAQHTPGHQQIDSLIQNNGFDAGAFTQDLIILSLVALYPSCLIISKLPLSLKK